jgi:glucose/arabinose dehydrogenase
MTLSPNGTLFVGTRQAGKVYAILDRDHDNVADTVLTIAQGLQMPNGVAFHDGALYVAEVSRILRYDNIEAHLTAPPAPVVLIDKYPRDTHHGWKFIRLGPDGLLYVPVGAPCNICQRSDERYASITRLKLDGTGFEIVAHGVRNTVGFDWHPETQELWFTDNGRDLLGDDVPPDEPAMAKTSLTLNLALSAPAAILPHQYWLWARMWLPWACASTPVPCFLRRTATRSSLPSTAPGIAKKIGYRVMRVQLHGEQAIEYTPFAEGWLQGEKAWGRPVDVQVMPDGALLVSDDYAGAIYRISYQK